MATSSEAEICDIFKVQELNENQRKAIQAIRESKDVFVGTKTGSGKSLIYECFPLIRKGSSVLIIAPLLGIMEEQCRKLTELGFTATYIGKDHNENELIQECKFQFLFSSPESLIGNTKWRTMLKSEIYQDKLKLIVVDEAHTVTQWGEGSKDDDPFRVMFSRTGELRSLCNNAQILALTATTSPTQRRRIMKILCFTPENCVIIDNPDRPNIKISVMRVPNTDNLEETFHFLIDALSKLKVDLPRHVIFSETIVNVSKIYSTFVKAFGQSCEFFDMFHSKTSSAVKEKIRNDMAVDGKIRILICTNSAGMGVNFHGLNNVVHYGLPREMNTFVQQMGRAGRDGGNGKELVIYKEHKGHLNKVEVDLVKLVKDSSQCRHYAVCSAYAVEKVPIIPLHNCCDVCENKCTCGDEKCPEIHEVFKTTLGNVDDDGCDAMRRAVSEEDRKLLRHKLLALKYSFQDPSSFIPDEIIHGITDKVIDGVVCKAESLFTTADILRNLQIWSYEIAVKIFHVINEVFGDAEMYGLLSDGEYDSDDNSD